VLERAKVTREQVDDLKHASLPIFGDHPSRSPCGVAIASQKLRKSTPGRVETEGEEGQSRPSEIDTSLICLIVRTFL